MPVPRRMKNALVRMNLHFFWKIIASEIEFESPSPTILVREIKATGLREIERFTMVKLQDAVKHLRRNDCVDSNGIVAESFCMRIPNCMNNFFPVFNSMLLAGHVITKGKQTTFSTIPKTRNLTNPENWRPFAFLNINKNFSTRMVEKRVRPILEAQQSNDKIGFRFSRLLENCVQVYGMVGPDVVCKFEFVETALIILTTMRCLML